MPTDKLHCDFPDADMVDLDISYDEHLVRFDFNYEHEQQRYRMLFNHCSRICFTSDEERPDRGDTSNIERIRETPRDHKYIRKFTIEFLGGDALEVHCAKFTIEKIDGYMLWANPELTDSIRPMAESGKSSQVLVSDFIDDYRYTYSLARSCQFSWQRSRHSEENQLVATLVLLNRDMSGSQLRIDCLGVTNLKLHDELTFNSGLGDVMIEDISERQWDGLRFHVFESEDEGFDFYCADLSIMKLQ